MDDPLVSSHGHRSDEPFSIHELREVVDASSSLAERLGQIMALLDGVNAALASLASDAQAATDRVSTDLANVAAARDTALAQVADLQNQVATLQAGAVTQDEINATAALVAQVAAAVQAIDAPPAPPPA